MPILHVEHAISDFDTWQRAFDSDPVGREESGVRRYRVLRPIDDPRYVVLDLEFDTRGDAEAFHIRLRDLWRSRQAAPALVGSPQVRILETAASRELGRPGAAGLAS